MTFGQRLRQLRIAANLTQEALARQASMSLSAIAKMENKAVDPSWSTALRLARALGVSVAAFDTEAEQSEDKPKRRGK